MIHQILFFSPGGVGWSFKIENDILVPDENEITSGIFTAIKMFANSEAMWENNIEYISWVHGYTIFSSSENKFTLAISTDKEENPSDIFTMAEKIREKIIESYYEQIIKSDQFFCDGMNVRNKLLPILAETLQESGYLQ
jgi:hypothetical protein